MKCAACAKSATFEKFSCNHDAQPTVFSLCLHICSTWEWFSCTHHANDLLIKEVSGAYDFICISKMYTWHQWFLSQRIPELCGKDSQGMRTLFLTSCEIVFLKVRLCAGQAAQKIVHALTLLLRPRILNCFISFFFSFQWCFFCFCDCFYTHCSLLLNSIIFFGFNF